MKTTLVSLIFAGVWLSASISAQPGQGRGGPPEGSERRHQPRGFMDAWQLADANRDGFLSPEEFATLPRLQGLPEERRAALFARLDKNGDGRISRDEIELIGRRPPGEGPPPQYPQRLWELDTDGSGCVSFEEFQRGRIYSKLPGEKQRALFDRLDTNKDGVICPKDRPQPRLRPDRPDKDGCPQRGERPHKPERGPGGRPDRKPPHGPPSPPRNR